MAQKILKDVPQKAASGRSPRPYKLYFVDTPSPEENCFVVARTARTAAKFEQANSGFDPGDCKATLLCRPDDEWIVRVKPDKDEDWIDAFYVLPKEVTELGVKWLIMDGDNYFTLGEKEFFAQGGANWIAGTIGPKNKIVIASVADLLEIIERDAAGDWVFRGHSSCRWDLRASVHRLRRDELDEASMISFERRLLGEFKRKSRMFLPTPPQTDWEWLILAQHFGLPTRLLDWTENPLVALFFSVRENEAFGDDGMLFAYRHGYPEVDVSTGLSPFDIKRIEVVRPPHLDQRVIAQRSVFTAEPVPLEGTQSDQAAIRSWHVSGMNSDVIREELEKLGVSESTLFPGLESLAKEIRYDSRVWGR